jgi:ureidoacrylate peracid hydrolase
MSNDLYSSNDIVKGLFLPGKTAVLVIDVQNEYLNASRLQIRGLSPQPDIRAKISKLKQFIEKAREKDVVIVWTQMAESISASPEPISQKIMLDMQAFGGVALDSTPGQTSYNFIEDLAPIKTDVVIKKNHYDAFSNPKLIKALKQMGVSSVVLTGGYASRCVFATAHGAINNDLHVLALEDLMFYPLEFIAELPTALNIINSIIGYTTSSDELLSSWG